MNMNLLRRSASLALVCAGLCSCSTLTPQVFHPDLLTRYPYGQSEKENPCLATPPTPGSAIEIKQAISSAECVRNSYLQAVKDLSEVGAGTSASLIGITALSLLKGVTNPNSADLATAGIGGAALYTYANAMTSKPRQMVFLTGADALNCAIGATRPLEVDEEMLDGKPAVESGRSAGLLWLAAEAQRSSVSLSSHLRKLAPYALDSEKMKTEGKDAPADCATMVHEDCSQLAGTDAKAKELQKACVVREQGRKKKCSGKTSHRITEQGNPDAKELVAKIKAQIRHMDRQIATAESIHSEYKAAANRLSVRTVAIQIKVATEVLKTEPDLASVMNSVQAMRGSAYSISKAPALAPETTGKQSSDSGGSSTMAAQSSAQPKLQVIPDKIKLDAITALNDAKQDSDNLSLRLASLNSKLRQARHQVDSCFLPGSSLSNGLTVVPGVEEVKVAKGKSVSFSVIAQQGVIPKATLGAKGNTKLGTVKRSIDDQNQFVFEYTADAAADDGATVFLSITGDPRAPAHEVSITIGNDAGGK